MITLTLAEIAAVVQGRLASSNTGNDRLVTGVEFDSRRVAPGDLFLALRGERVHGNDFAPAAIAAGAVGVIADEDLGVAGIVVADPAAALTVLATVVAPRLAARVIAVTGSSGKTSTKDLLAQVLETVGPTVAPPGSFNNELGYPYTVLLANERTRFLVLEASARGLGHIRQLTQVAQPSIGVVLNVGRAHLGEFGSMAVTAQAKGELVEALPPADEGGVAVLNADDPLVAAMASRTRARVVFTSGQADNGAEVGAADIQIDGTGRARFDLVIDGRRGPVSLQVHGEHQVANALAVAAVGWTVGMQVSAIAAALSGATARSRWRMEVTETKAGVTVINDAYNANPESMRAALKALATMSEGRRCIAVLGQMAELGADSVAEHDAIGRLAVRFNVQQLIAVGPVARPIANGAALEGSWDAESEWAADNAAALVRLGELVQPGDVVLVKGSRSTGLEQLAASLIDSLGGPG